MEKYFLLDLERTLAAGIPCYWKGNRYGYTYELDYAGIFPKELAAEIVKNDLDERTIMVPYKLAFDLGLLHKVAAEESE